MLLPAAVEILLSLALATVVGRLARLLSPSPTT